MSAWDRGSAPALKSPLMTDKDIIKRTWRKTRWPPSSHDLHSANTHRIDVCVEVEATLSNFALWQPQVAVTRNFLKA